MTPSAPLQVTVELHLASGERRFRLTHRLQLPPALAFHGPLPVEGEELGRVSLRLPDGTELQKVWARLHFDPEHPERGSRAELLDLRAEVARAIQSHVEQWEESA
jgi:hypothetical protein